MAAEDLTVRARIDDELSRPLEVIRERVEDVGDEAESSSRRAARSARGWGTFGRATERAGKMAHTAGRLAKGALLGIAAGTAAAAYAAGRLAMSSIQQASDLNESLNAVNVTYGKQATAVKKLGREAAKSLGLSNVEFNGMAVQFAAFATAIGGEGKGAVKVLDDVTTRAADFASVMNLDVAEAAALFQSGLAGESEPLRKYGINLSAAAVGSYAVAKGISESATEMTDAQKVQATYGLLMEKTSKTQGDFTNTSDALANQQRILGARMDNAQAKLGRGLLPVMQTGAQWLNREGVPAFLRFSDWFNKEGLPAIGRFVDKARTFYDTHGPQIRSTLADVRDVAREGADAAKALVDAFLGMPSWARKLLVGGAVGGVAAKKLGAFGLLKGLGKGAGGLTSLASKAKPLPVFVVNNGIGGDGPGGGGKGGKAGKWLGRFGAGGAVAAGPLTALGLSMYGLDEAGKLGKTEGNRRAAAGSPYGGVWTQVDTGISRDEIEKLGEIGKRAGETYAAAMDLARAKAAGFGKELDLVGARKINPQLAIDGMKPASTMLADFLTMQINAGRPVAPYIDTTSISRAREMIASLSAEIHAIPTAGVDNSVPYVSGGNRPYVAPPRNPGRGGSGGSGNPNAVERRVGRPTAGGNGGSTVNIHPGGVVVNNPRSDVDVTRAIANYVREREERR